MTGDVVWTSAAFNGSGNVTGTATIQPNSVALGTDTTGNYVGAGAVSGIGLSGSLAAEGGTFTVVSNATDVNTGATLVARDASGNFSAGIITAALSGNASTATALATGRTISLTGDVTGTSASFNGTGNVSIAATIAANSVALGTDTTGNYVSSIANGSYLTGGGSSAENKAYTLGVDATSANTASKVVARNASGDFAAGTITATAFVGDGSGLTGVGGVPTGCIVMWSGAEGSIPSGWVLCNGLSSTPDLRNRFIVGAGTGGSYAIGATGGANTISLATGNLPSHTHSFSATTSNIGNHTHTGSTSNTGAHNHTATWSNSFGGNNVFHQMKTGVAGTTGANAIANTGAHSHNFTTAAGGTHSHTVSGTSGATGSGTALTSTPLYYALAYIMKT